MLKEGSLTADILDKCVKATWSSRENRMKYRFTPPTEAKGWVMAYCGLLYDVMMERG